MKKRTTENIQLEPKLNTEQQTIDTTSRQTIANTNVTSRFFSSHHSFHQGFLLVPLETTWSR